MIEWIDVVVDKHHLDPSLATITLLCATDYFMVQMDFPAFGNNIEEYMQSTGTPDEVTKGRAPDLTPDIVEKFDVAMGKDGVLTLSPKHGVDGDGSSSSPPPAPSSS